MKQYDAQKQREKAYMNGGGEQPITRRQLIRIEKLSNKLNSSGNAIAQNKFGRPMSQLKGEEANELIRWLIDRLDLCK